MAKMSNPWAITGTPVRLSRPTYGWETAGYKVNEGPFALQHNGRTFITYSASHCNGPNYRLGMLTYVGGDPLAASSWTKSAHPVFQRDDAAGVFGPGHNSFFSSPDGTETWIAYHANSSASDGCGTTRTTRVQKISWHADGTPDLGTPVSTSTVLPAPSGETGTPVGTATGTAACASTTSTGSPSRAPGYGSGPAATRPSRTQKYRLSRKPETWRYEWDVEDRIVGVVTPDSTRWRYTYDPLGRRTSKTRLADDSDTVVERTLFTWDGATLCEQLTDSPDLPGPVALTWDHQGMHPLTQTERILGGDSPQETVDSRFFAIVTDLIGTPSELVDEQGDIAWQARSTVWGTTSWARGSSTYTPLRFPGQYFDPETGLHYNHFRHYDPETARYVSPDPLGLAAAPNSVAYVHNPHLWVDPFGLTPCKDAAKNAKDKQTTPLGKEIPTREEGSVGSTADHKYKRTFFNEHPELKGKVVVHHAIEQQVLKRYPGLFSADEIHSLENLRGIPKGDINSKVHLSDIRVSWNEFYRTHSNPTRQDVLDHVTHVDDKLGNWFSPRIR